LLFAGVRILPVPVAVRHTSGHLRRRLLEDLGSSAASGKGRRRPPEIQYGTSCRNERRNSCKNSERRRDSARQADRRQEVTGPGRRSGRVKQSVPGTAERRQNDGLHHRVFHALLDADVPLHHDQENDRTYGAIVVDYYEFYINLISPLQTAWPNCSTIPWLIFVLAELKVNKTNTATI